MDKFASNALVMALALFVALGGLALVLYVVLPAKPKDLETQPLYYICPNCQRRVDVPRVHPPERETMPTPNLRPQGSLTGDKGAEK